MQVNTELQPMFSYSFLSIIFIIILIVLIYLFTKYHKKKELKKTINIPNKKNIISIKNKYLVKIQHLSKELNDKKITNRQAYQSLSNIIRNFIYETTNIKVQNYTLKDISSIDMPILYELVSEYYDPEFAKISKGNIVLSIEKTKMVIEKWN